MMRTFFGMILGCLLTVAVVYVHDAMAVPASVGSVQASTSKAIVNWDVARSEWGQVTETARTAWLKLRASPTG